jgi:hypothetical protein
MQVGHAATHRHRLARLIDVRFQRFAGARERLVEFGLDPLQGSEVDMFLESHASLSAIASCMA